MKRTSSTSTRDRLLDAAEAVVIEQGVNAMTLEAVAARAKVSKGGLLYHFPSKDAVVQGMVSRIASIVQQRFASGLATEPSGPGRHARRILRAHCFPGCKGWPVRYWEPYPAIRKCWSRCSVSSGECIKECSMMGCPL